MVLGCENIGHAGWDLAGLAGTGPQRRGVRPRRWAVVGLQQGRADVQGLLGRGLRPQLGLAYGGARRADELGVEREHRSDAVHDAGDPEPRGQQGPRRLEDLVDDDVGAPLLGHREQVGEPGERRRAEQRHHPVHHLLFLGEVRIRPHRLVRRPRLCPRGSDCVDIEPAAESGPSRSGPVATRTSFPARSAARINGSIGSTCPYAGHDVNSTRAMPAACHVGPHRSTDFGCGTARGPER